MTMVLEKEKIDGIIFDLDGTLWDTTMRICEAWNCLLKKHTEIQRAPITEADLAKCMGHPMYEIASMLFPNEEVEVRNALMDEMCAFENDYLLEHGGILYEGLEETLAALSAKYPLYIVSNCQEGYIETFLQAHHMEKYFKDTECWGRTRVSKGESNLILMKRNGLQSPVYVGDTAGDEQSAIDAGIPFIYVAYGFGDAERYVAKIEKIGQLLEVL